MSLHNRIVNFINELNLEVNCELEDDTSLIRSGILDSLGLFHLAEWIEREIDTPIDLTKFNLSEDWDTISDIVKFIEKHRKNNFD
jgi:acyl carrier protein